VRDFSAHAVDFHGKAGAGPSQQDQALAAVRRPDSDPERFARVWQQVEDLSGSYAMNEGAAAS
jgi:acyl-CoA dehydrogenase